VGNTLNNILIKGLIDQVHGCLAVFAPSNELGDHRVIVHRNLRALLHTSVDSNVLVGSRLLILPEEAN
jgi:hypothetical protein